MSEPLPPRIKLNTSFHIPPFTDEVVEALKEVKQTYDACKADKTTASKFAYNMALRRLGMAQDKAIGPWRIFG